MITETPEIVPSEICLACDGCCRFAAADSPWRPKVTATEADAFGGDVDADGALKTLETDGQPQCLYFRAGDRTCRVYDRRPFECRIYPFLLLEHGNGMALGLHLSCPYVQDHRDGVFKRHIEEMQTFLARRDVRTFLKDNPGLAGAYPDHAPEIEILLELF